MTDEGSGTVWVLVCALLLAGATGLVAVRGFVAIDRHRAAAVADQAALAAASRLFLGADAACGAAGDVAAASGGALLSCRTSADASVEVVVAVPPVGPLAGFPPVRVHARAGRSPPVSADRAPRRMRG